MLVRTLTLIIFTSFLALHSHAQIDYRSSEYGFSIGGANYFGDLNQDYGFNYFRQSGGVFYKLNFSKYIALRFAANYAHVGYNDSYSDNFYQQQRNLSFKTDIYEASVMADFHFFKYDLGDFENRFTPYICLGIGAFHYDPYAEIEGVKVDLRPLGTEGQIYEKYADRRYKSVAVSFPIGAGFKFWMSRGLTFGFEIINRLSTTDYLDDVSTTYVGASLFPDAGGSTPYQNYALQLQDRSPEVTTTAIGIEGRQRGISSTRDQFLTAQVYISFRLPTYRCPSRR